MGVLLIKDISLLVEWCYRYNDSLSFDGMQEGLREHAYTLTSSILSEDQSIASQTHWSWFKAIAVNPYGLMTAFTRSFLSETKTTEQEKDKS